MENMCVLLLSCFCFNQSGNFSLFIAPTTTIRTLLLFALPGWSVGNFLLFLKGVILIYFPSINLRPSKACLKRSWILALSSSVEKLLVFEVAATVSKSVRQNWTLPIIPDPGIPPLLSMIYVPAFSRFASVWISAFVGLSLYFLRILWLSERNPWEVNPSTIGFPSSSLLSSSWGCGEGERARLMLLMCFFEESVALNGFKSWCLWSVE